VEEKMGSPDAHDIVALEEGIQKDSSNSKGSTL